MKPRSANTDDKKMGLKIRSRRMELKISQADLGEQLGVSFQQIQKYEKGVNRVGAGRMQQIATALDVPVTYFFDAVGTEMPVGDVAAFMTSADGIAIAKAVMSLADPKARRTVRDLVELIAASKVSISPAAQRRAA